MKNIIKDNFRNESNKIEEDSSEKEYKPDFNDEELAAFDKLFSAKNDDERRIRIRQLMNATKKRKSE